MRALLVRGGTVLTMNATFDRVEGGVWIVDGRIEAVGPDAERAATPGATVLDRGSRGTFPPSG